MAEIEYSSHGDYLLPNLTVPEEPKADGKYASLRRKYWVGRMNNIRQAAEEIVLEELIYS